MHGLGGRDGVVTYIPAVLTPATGIKVRSSGSSCKIRDDQAIKMSVCAAQIKVKNPPKWFVDTGNIHNKHDSA